LETSRNRGWSGKSGSPILLILAVSLNAGESQTSTVHIANNAPDGHPNLTCIDLGVVSGRWKPLQTLNEQESLAIHNNRDPVSTCALECSFKEIRDSHLSCVPHSASYHTHDYTVMLLIFLSFRKQSGVRILVTRLMRIDLKG
jgi:hypothetical protein